MKTFIHPRLLQGFAIFLLAFLLLFSVSQAQTLSATAASYQQVNLSWPKFVHEGSSVGVEYKWVRIHSSFIALATVTESASGTQSYQDNSVPAATEIAYRLVYRYFEPGMIATQTRYSNEVIVNTPMAPPKTPINLILTDSTATSITIRWTGNQGKDGGAAYVIERSADGGSFSQIHVTAFTEAVVPTFIDTGLRPGARYCYRVKARGTGGDSGYTNTACGNTRQGAPSSPDALIAKANLAFQIELYWIDRSNNETGFEIERSTDNSTFTKITTTGANVTQFFDGPLTPGTRYYYRVRAINSAGASGYTNVANDVTVQDRPTTPAGLVANTASSSQINLTWRDISDNESGFELERSTDGTNFSKVADIGANTISYENGGLNPLTKYWYRIRAKNSGGYSGYSNVAEATTQDNAPNTPQNLNATPISNTQINLNWGDNSGNETGFELERSTDGSNFAKLTDLPANATTYENTGLSTLTKYWYRIRAKNAIGNSGYSNVAETTTFDVPPIAPTSLTATTISASQIDLAWKDNSGNESGFDIERSTDGTNFAKVGETGANATSFNSNDLAPATKYWYRVRSKNSQGGSTYTNVADATTRDVVPNAPQNLSAAPVSNTQIRVSWNDNSGNESGFELERSANGTTFVKIADIPANATSYENTGLTTLTKYWYRIRAKNAIGNSGYSNVAETTTYDVPPTAPEGLTATTISSSQINLAWKDLSTNETGFQLEQSIDGTNFVKIADLAANSTSYQNTGLSPATKYWYRVRAVNTANPSAFSNVANATTIDVLPLAPENLAATVINYGQIDLAWADKSRNEAGFQLERSTDGTSFTKIADVAANAVAHQDKTAASLTKYYYRVRAINPIGPSAYSNIATATTPQAPIPDKPQNLTAVPVDFDLIQLKWSTLSRNATSVVIERSDRADQGFVQIGNQAAAIIEFGDREILPINDYYYRIKAVNVAGSSAYSDVVKVDASAIITGVEPPVTSSDLIYVYNRVLYVKRNSAVKATLRMFSSNGTRLMQCEVNQDFKAQLQNLSSGLYIVVVESDRGIVTQKVLVN